jgi:hypothetical protein
VGAGGAVQAVAVLAASGGAAAVVLRDLAPERPAKPAPVPRPAPPAPLRAGSDRLAPSLPAHDVPAGGEDGSVLARLTATEADERSTGRRVVSALVLLTLTLLAATVVGAVIYRGLAALG